MISLLDIAERAHKGPRMEEKEWNLELCLTGRDYIALLYFAAS